MFVVIRAVKSFDGVFLLSVTSSKNLNNLVVCLFWFFLLMQDYGTCFQSVALSSPGRRQC